MRTAKRGLCSGKQSQPIYKPGEIDLFSVTLRVAAGFVAVLALLCCGCNQSDFSAGTAQGLIAQRAIHIDAEQVMLTQGQVDCGKENELWEPAPAGFAGGESSNNSSNLVVAHLTSKGRELQFDDDVVLSEPGYPRPYVQIRGDFVATLADASVHDDGDAKKVEGRLLIVVNHSCFADPLPLMGVKKGKFNQDALPLMRFTQEADGWHFDKLIH